MTQERIHRVIVSGGIGGGPSMPGMAAGGGAPAPPPVQNIQSPNLNLMAQHLREISANAKGLGGTIKAAGKEMGIKFSVGGILKQSQLFTGMIGSIFQIAGAAVDIFLATFMPILIPAIRGIASWLPVFRSFLDNTLGALVRWVVKGVSWIMGGPIKDLGGKVGEWAAAILEKLGVSEDNANTTGDTIASGFGPVVLALGALGATLILSKIGAARAAIGFARWAGKWSGFNAFMRTGLGKAIGTSVGKVFGKGSLIGRGVSGIGGLFGKAKGAIGAKLPNLNPKIIGGGKTGLLGKLGGKAGLKLIPGIGAAYYAIEGIVDGVKNFNEARKNGKGLWQSVALGGATAAAGLTSAAVSLGNPLAGMALNEAGKIGVNAMMNQWGGTDRNLLQGTLAGLATQGVMKLTVNVNGQTVEDGEVALEEHETQKEFARGDVQVAPQGG